MKYKKYFVILVLILFLAPAVLGAYNTYKGRSFVVADGKDIDLNGQAIGEGTTKNLTCSSNCTGFDTNGSIGLVIGGSTIGTGLQPIPLKIEKTGTITSVYTYMGGGVSASLTYEIWGNTSTNLIASGPPVAADSIGTFTLSSVRGQANTSISQAVTAQDLLWINVSSVSGVNNATIYIGITV